MRSKSPLQNPFCPATSTKNRSYSGFYCTPDLEQNAELRILLRCSPTPYFLKPMRRVCIESPTVTACLPRRQAKAYRAKTSEDFYNHIRQT
jgi:hypothetical protein